MQAALESIPSWRPLPDNSQAWNAQMAMQHCSAQLRRSPHQRQLVDQVADSLGQAVAFAPLQKVDEPVRAPLKQRGQHQEEGQQRCGGQGGGGSS